jgi:hypothetical protein
MITILLIRISNGQQWTINSKQRTIRDDQLEPFRNKLKSKYHANIDFTFKSKPTPSGQ